MRYSIISYVLFRCHYNERCPWRRCRCRCRVATVVAVAVRLRQVLEEVIAAAAAFFSRTLKNCMNLVEFQCLQMKHPETEWIWWSSTNISGPIQARKWNLEHFFWQPSRRQVYKPSRRGSGAVRFFYKPSRQRRGSFFYKPSRCGSGSFSAAMDISDVF